MNRLLLGHTKEFHLFLSKSVHILSRKDSTNASLDEYTRVSFLVLLILGLRCDTSLDFFHEFRFFKLLLDRLEDEQYTLTTLSTSVVLLDESDCLDHIDIKSERILHNLVNGSIVLVALDHHLVYQLLFLD